MTYRMLAVGFADSTQACPHSGEWLESFDHEAHNGQGFGTFTRDPDKAMQFASVAEAMEFWRKQSTVRPWRFADGAPNRPLTALTVEITKDY